MTMEHIIVALCNLFLLFIIWRYYRDLLEPVKELCLIRYLIGGAWFLITFLSYEFLHSEIINIFLSVILLWIMTVTYNGNARRKALTVIMVETLNGVCDYLSWLIFGMLFKEGDVYAVSYAGTIILSFVSEVIVRKTVHKDKNTELTWKEICILMTVPMGIFVIMYCMLRAEVSGGFLTIAVLCMLVICFAVFFLYGVLSEEHIDRYREQNLNRQIDSYRKELERIESTEIRIEGIRHDLKHHLFEMGKLIKDGKSDEAGAYIRRMEADMADDGKVSHTGKYEIDSLVNYMIGEARKSLSEVNVNISIPHDFNIESYRLNIILGNLLENAIEAAGRSVEKSLSLYVSMQRGLLFINLSNSYDGTLIENKGRFLSTKPDKRAHGLGLQNVKRMVREMNGEMLIEHDENNFCVKIMLYI